MVARVNLRCAKRDVFEMLFRSVYIPARSTRGSMRNEMRRSNYLYTNLHEKIFHTKMLLLRALESPIGRKREGERKGKGRDTKRIPMCSCFSPESAQNSLTRRFDANVTNLRFSFPLGACQWNLPCKLRGVVSRSRTYLYFPWETLVTTERLPGILRNKIMFLISTSCIWFEFHLQISRCRSPLATLFFSLTPTSFRRGVREGERGKGVTRIFRVEITSRSPLYLECYKLFRDSHLNVSHNAEKVLPSHRT